eukprot:TRINITY_DN24484_c0_g2_i1.p1 TRINITY_DN24484_c0_g2~~TRINITY_DN24484_c0_g2_i1.p1  ORF type:complete len:128 (+),score=33.13 TRINITY_DN24484_c0_g2_i1:303-686(+)
MKEDEFISKRSSWITKKLEKFQNVYEEHNFFWHEISTRRCHFSRREDEAALMKTVTQGDVAEFFTKFVDPSSALRKKVSSKAICKIHSKAFAGERKEGELETRSVRLDVILNIQDFQRKSFLYPCFW